MFLLFYLPEILLALFCLLCLPFWGLGWLIDKANAWIAARPTVTIVIRTVLATFIVQILAYVVYIS